MQFLASFLYALVAASALTLCLGFLYYIMALAMMWVMRRVLGEDHRGYYFLNIVLFAVPITFLLVFARIVRGS